MRPRTLVLSLLIFVSQLATAETPVAPLVFGPAPGNQTQARIAANDGTYFAVWADERDQIDIHAYGARLAADGTLLDPLGILLGDVGAPRAVGCGAGRCLVVDALLRFAIVDRDARLGAAGTIADSVSPRTEVIYNGRDFLVVGGISGVQAWTLSVDGELRGAPVTIVPLRERSVTRFEAAAFNGSRLVVLYNEDDLLKAAVATSTGNPLTTDVVLAPISTAPAGIAASGSEFAAVWREREELRALRFGADGAWIGDPVTVRGASGFAFDIAREGDGYVVYTTEVWPDTRLTATRLSPTLVIDETRAVMAPAPFAISALAAASVGSGSLAVFDVHHPNQDRGMEVYAAGAAAPPVMVSRAAAAQRGPKIAVGPGTMLVISEEDRGGGADRPLTSIQATLTDRRTGQSSTFAVAPSGEAQIMPEVAAAGDAYLVTWFERERLRARILRDGEGGVTLDIAEQPLRSASVSSDGRDFFVAWFDVTLSGIGTMKISATGEVLARGEPIPLNIAFGAPAIAIACGGDGCLVAWRRVKTIGACRPFPCNTEESVLAARMTTFLVLRDATAIVLDTIPYGIGHVSAAAAHDDGTYAVAWDTPIDSSVRARSIDALGAAGPVTVGPVMQRRGFRSTIARQGDAWLLLRDTSLSADARIVATRFRDAAAVDFSVTPVDARTRRHASAANDGERVVVAYERTTHGEAAGGPPRAYVDAIDAPPRKSRAVRP